MQINKIISEIHNMDQADLNRVVEAVKYARSQNHRSVARSLSIGDAVSFEGRYGKTVNGVVKKINIKYVVVNCGIDGNWRVPAAHLTVRLAA